MSEKRSRRPNRTSTWYQDKNGKWHGRVWMGTKPDGRPDRRHRERESEPEIIKAIRELEKKRDAGKTPKPGRKPKMVDWCEYVLTVVLPRLKRSPKTIQGYRSEIKNWIVPAIGQTRLDEIHVDQLEELYAHMDAEGMADNHIRNVHAIIRSFLNIAIRRGKLDNNVAEMLDAPPPPGPSATEYLTRREARAVINASQAEGRRNTARWPVGLALGTRQGETLGLRWPFLVTACAECGAVDSLTDWWDRDLSACEECGHREVAAQARIWWQLQRLTWQHGCEDTAECTAGKHRQACPKNCAKARRKAGRKHVCVPRGADGLCTKGCERHASTCPQRKGGGLVFREIKEKRRKTVGVAPELVALLKSHWTRQREERLGAGDQWQDHGLVFAQWNGQPIDPRNDWEEWRDLLTVAGLPHRKVHAARHTAATLALESGVALAVVGEMLGHSDIRVTRGYTHVASPLMDAGAARLGKTLFSE